LKQIAPVKEVFLKKLSDLNCESIFTVALVNSTSDTRYVSGSAAYSPYSYGAYGGYGGYGAHGAYGGFGGYYGYTVSTMGNPGITQPTINISLRQSFLTLKQMNY
jgi:hypothetical protein